MPRPPVSFIAWTNRPGRATEIAHALGGEAHPVFPPRLASRKAAPLRYVVSALATLAYLLRRRPQAVIVTMPPVVAAIPVWLYSTLFRKPFVLDSHPTAFGAKNHRVSQALLPLSRFLAKRARTNLVTTQHWIDVLHSWGAEGELLHEAPPEWSVTPATPVTNERNPRVLFVSIFGGDEPVSEVVTAAQQLPSVEFFITGDTRRAPAGLRDSLPSNVHLTGYLQSDSYVQALQDADIVLALTTEPTSVMRAAYEAVYAERPLVLTGTPALRELFPDAIAVDNDPNSIADGIRQAIERHDDLRVAAPRAKEQQLARWNEQLARLQRHLSP